MKLLVFLALLLPWSAVPLSQGCPDDKSTRKSPKSTTVDSRKSTTKPPKFSTSNSQKFASKAPKSPTSGSRKSTAKASNSCTSGSRKSTSPTESPTRRSPTDSPTSSPSQNQGAATVTLAGGSVFLDGIVNVTYPPGALGEDTFVSLMISSDPVINDQFSEFTSMFRPGDRLSYEVQVLATNPPITESILVSLEVPLDFAESIPPGYKMEVFALIETGDADEEDFSVFELLEGSDYDPTTRIISFELPGAAFVEDLSQGLFVAVLTLAPTPGGTIRRLRGLRYLQSSDCKAASIRCPVAGGCTVTSPYNRERRHPVTGVLRPHYGTDYRAPTGTSIVAAAGGTVERSYTSSSYGETVIIRHTDGSATLYAHLSSRDVSVGDSITVGGQIGLSGNTGLSSGPHLHLEYVPSGQIIQSKNRIDPDACIGDVTSGSITAGDNGSVADD